MKKLLLIVVGIALISLPVSSFAGVSGSDHDLRTSALDDNQDGLALNLCTSCHLPHNATGSAKLWAGSAAGTAIGDLCESCHDGTVVILGANVFDGSGSLHANADGSDATDKASCSGQSTSCHDVHEQNANGTGKFLQGVTFVGGTDDPCVACHDATPAPGWTGGDRNGTGNHGQVGCTTCHTPNTASVHGTYAVAVTQTGGIETAGAGTWLLPVDNNAAGNWGGACVACHENSAPYVGVHGAGGGGTSTFANAAYATDARHTTSGQSRGFTPISGCNECHYMHNNGSDTEMLQLVDNVKSAGCINCHDGGGDAPDIGANSHPINVAYTAVASFPASDNIDDDGDGSADYTTADVHIVCESCHSVHRHGVAGSGSFLRDDNTAANEICLNCHAN